MADNMVFVCDEVTPEMMALDELLSTDDLSEITPIGFSLDAEDMVEITREITIDPRRYRSTNYQPDPNIPNEPDPEDDIHDDMTPSIGQDEAVALDAAKPGSKANLPCKTAFGNCQAKNPLLCPYHGAKLIEADIKAGLASTIPNAIVSVKPSSSASQSKGKNFSISIKVPASQKLAAEQALDNFLQQPGIKSQGMKDWDPRSGEWSDFYDIDLLQLNQPPQGGMANRAALSNSLVSAAQPQPTSQNPVSPVKSTSAQTPASTPATSVAQPTNTSQSNQTIPNSLTSETSIPPALSALLHQLGLYGAIPMAGSPNMFYNIKLPGAASNYSALQSLANQLPQGLMVTFHSNGHGYIVNASDFGRHWNRYNHTVLQPSPAGASSATATATTSPSTTINSQNPVPGYQTQTDVADDRKFITSMKGLAGLDEIADLEDLVDEKEQLQEQIDATRLAMSNGDSADAQMYQGIIDYALGGLKEVDEKVLEMREALDAKYNTKNCQPAGATCAQIKANLQAQGATFIPKALDGLDNVMNSKIASCRQTFINAGLTEAQDSTTWDKIQELVSKSLEHYLTNAAIRSYCSGDTPHNYFFSDSTGPSGRRITPGAYYNNYDADITEDNYGVQYPTLKEYRLCASATDASKSAFDRGQSGWGGSCAFTIRKSNTFCAYQDHNTGGSYGRSYNGTPISKPSILSLGRSPRSYISWIRGMLATGQPDLTYGRAKEEQLTGNGWNEVHAFCGCDTSKKSEKILAHIESLEYDDKSYADTVIKFHAKELKQYGIKVYYYDDYQRKNIEVQF